MAVSAVAASRARGVLIVLVLVQAESRVRTQARAIMSLNVVGTHYLHTDTRIAQAGLYIGQNLGANIFKVFKISYHQVLL